MILKIISFGFSLSISWHPIISSLKKRTKVLSKDKPVTSPDWQSSTQALDREHGLSYCFPSSGVRKGAVNLSFSVQISCLSEKHMMALKMPALLLFILLPTCDNKPVYPLQITVFFCQFLSTGLDQVPFFTTFPWIP